MKTAISINDGRQRLEQMLLRLNEAYADRATPEEKPLLKAIKARTRRAVKDRW